MLFLYAMDLKKMIEKGLTAFHIPFDEGILKELCFYTLELKKWNEHINLVGLKDVELIVRELLYDTFFLYGHVRRSKTLLDMGSGAGIVAIPLKILNGKMDIFSVDKGLKKIQFQRHIKRSMHLKGLTLLQSRIETLEPIEVDSLAVKGFGDIKGILEKGGRHVRENGHAFILKGTKEDPIDYQGFDLKDVIPYRLPMNEKAYRLFIYKKI